MKNNVNFFSSAFSLALVARLARNKNLALGSSSTIARDDGSLHGMIND